MICGKKARIDDCKGRRQLVRRGMMVSYYGINSCGCQIIKRIEFCNSCITGDDQTWFIYYSGNAAGFQVECHGTHLREPEYEKRHLHPNFATHQPKWLWKSDHPHQNLPRSRSVLSCVIAVLTRSAAFSMSGKSKGEVWSDLSGDRKRLACSLVEYTFFG